MILRLLVLVSFTTFIFGPIFGIFMAVSNLEFENFQHGNVLGFLTLTSLVILLFACSVAREYYPELVKNTLLWVALIVAGFLFWALTVPAITA